MAYIGQSPASVALTASDITDGIISNAKLAQDVISAETALGATPADTDEFLVSDAGTLKRMDYSHIKAGGAWNLLQTQTASSSALIEFDTTYITSSYSVYKIIISHLVPSAVGPNTEMFCQFKHGGSYITSGYGFSSFHHVDSSASSFSGAASASATAYQVTSDNLGGDTGENSSWEFTLDDPLGTANKKIMWGSGGNVNHDNSYSRESTIGGSFNVGAIEAIKFYMETGDFESGKFSLYGIST